VPGIPAVIIYLEAEDVCEDFCVWVGTADKTKADALKDASSTVHVTVGGRFRHHALRACCS
jgi:hypothetical protein